MKEIDFMTREEMIDVIETLAWRVAVAENSKTSTIDSEMVRRVLEEEGVKLVKHFTVSSFPYVSCINNTTLSASGPKALTLSFAHCTNCSAFFFVPSASLFNAFQSTL